MGESKLASFSEDGLRAVQQRMEALRIDLGASAAMLIDQAGQLLVECGRRGDSNLGSFLALLGSAMSAANEVVHVLRDEAAFDLHYHEGQNYEMYTARVTDQVFLTLMLERHGGTGSRVGMVWLSLRRAVAELRALLNSATIAPGTAITAEIKSAVSETLDQALDLVEKDILSKPVPQPAQDQVPKDAKGARKPPGSIPRAPTKPPRLLSYEEARALGLVNLDDHTEDRASTTNEQSTGSVDHPSEPSDSNKVNR